jgi:hypothetical protein
MRNESQAKYLININYPGEEDVSGEVGTFF